MTSLDSYRIMAIDMSFRDSGVAILDFSDNEIKIQGMSVNNLEFQMGFEGLFRSSLKITRSIDSFIELGELFMPDVIVVEMPSSSQSAKAALAIGMCWGAIGSLNGAILVEPSLLKRWSESKSGDKKTKVKEKVLERVYLSPKHKSNDNIVDAVGIALIFHDKIRKHKYENDKH